MWDGRDLQLVLIEDSVRIGRLDDIDLGSVIPTNGDNPQTCRIACSPESFHPMKTNSSPLASRSPYREQATVRRKFLATMVVDTTSLSAEPFCLAYENAP